jgi:hypothetical protein
LVAVELVDLIVAGDPEAGIAAHRTEVSDETFVSAAVGPAPKEPTPSMRQPHLLFVSAAGAANVPVAAAMVLPPLWRVTVLSESAIVSVYPAVRFVLTDTVSLADVAEPLAVGVILRVTVPLVVMLMTEPITASMVVDLVSTAANVAAGISTVPAKATKPALPISADLSDRFIYFCVLIISPLYAIVT